MQVLAASGAFEKDLFQTGVGIVANAVIKRCAAAGNISMLPIPTQPSRSITVMLQFYSGPKMPRDEKATVLMNLATIGTQYMSK